MATAELVTDRLKRSPVSERLSPQQVISSPLPTREKPGRLIEFDPSGGTSQANLHSSALPVGSDGRQGFVYDGVRAGPATRAGLSRRSAAFQPLPMEGVYLYVKQIDNTQVRRQPAPRYKRAWSRLVFLGFIVLMLVLMSFGPRPWMRHAGYRLEQLDQQYRGLQEINRQLKVRQAMLSDLRRITKLAAARGMTAPLPEHFAWQNRTITPPDGNELALSRNEMPK